MIYLYIIAKLTSYDVYVYCSEPSEILISSCYYS